MDQAEILKKVGLTDSQARVYCCLLQEGAMSPPELAKETGLSRENCYAIANRLTELGIIEHTDDKKANYRVLNPSALEVLAEKRRKIMAKNEKFVKDNLSSLMDIFYANNEMPGARTLEGLEGVKAVYEDTLRVGKDIYLLRTRADIVLGHDDAKSFIHNYRDERVGLGIHTYALTPVTKYAVTNNVKTGRDKAVKFHRTWMPEEDYTAPVEIQAYGDKVSLIAFGETEMATIIVSPLIAEAMRQVLKIMMNYYRKTFKQDY